MLDLFVLDAVFGGKIPTVVEMATEQDLAATKIGRQTGPHRLRPSCPTEWRCGEWTMANCWG